MIAADVALLMVILHSESSRGMHAACRGIDFQRYEEMTNDDDRWTLQLTRAIEGPPPATSSWTQ